MMMDPWMMGGWGMDKGWGKGTFKVDKSGGELGEFTGTIKSGGRAYSFIECPEANLGNSPAQSKAGEGPTASLSV